MHLDLVKFEQKKIQAKKQKTKKKQKKTKTKTKTKNKNKKIKQVNKQTKAAHRSLFKSQF